MSEFARSTFGKWPDKSAARSALFTIILTVLAPLFGMARAETVPEGWAVYPTPKRGSCEWTRAQFSNREWRVRLVGERLIIERENTTRPREPVNPAFDIPLTAPDDLQGAPCDGCVMRVEAGWLVGFNFGEFGGRLWWTDVKGQNRYVVRHVDRCTDIRGPGSERPFWRFRDDLGHVVSLQKSGDQIFAFSGLAHLGSSSGELARIDRVRGRWQACMVRNLGGAPLTATTDAPGSWLVLVAGGEEPVRDGSLIRVDMQSRSEHRAHPAFLYVGTMLFPTSMVERRDGTLYVGLRHFVARLIPNRNGGYREELLLPTNRPPFDFLPSADDPTKEDPVVAGCPRPK